MKHLIQPLFLNVIFLKNGADFWFILSALATFLVVINQVYIIKSKIINNHGGSVCKWIKSFFKFYKNCRKNDK